MTHPSVNELLLQIEHDYRESIQSVRQVMASNLYTNTDKKLIALKIVQLIEQMKLEVIPWTK